MAVYTRTRRSGAELINDDGVKITLLNPSKAKSALNNRDGSLFAAGELPENHSVHHYRDNPIKSPLSGKGARSVRGRLPGFLGQGSPAGYRVLDLQRRGKREKIGAVHEAIPAFA
jgi:hypothetical protein